MFMNDQTSKGFYGHRWWHFRFIRDTETAFQRLVARQCYNLTHEFILDKLSASRTDTRFTRNTDAAWMELDRAMREFADKY